MLRNLITRLFNVFNFLEKLPKQRLNIFVVCFIIALNSLLYILSNFTGITESQRRKDASGFSHDKAQHFAYFHYYKNIFPLSTLDSSLVYTKEGADKLISESGDNLIMEYEHWTRLGENARIFAYLPNSIVRGSPENPSVKLFNALIFTISLIVCYLGFAYANQSLLGALLVIAVNLTPYFWFEIYANENIFGLLGSLFLLMLGIHAKLIFNIKQHLIGILSLSILTGIITGVSSEIRGEVAILLGSIAFIYLLSSSIKWWVKPILICSVLFFHFSSKMFILDYFNGKFNEAYSIVEDNGGHTYDGVRIKGHIFWHAVYCGLGDFDEKYGYEWNDRVAYKYTIPILKDKYGIDLDYSGKLHPDNYYDEAKVYYKKFDDFPEHDLILKEKVLKDIKSDPLWYIAILIKRVIRVLSETLPFHFIGLLLIPLLYLLLKLKKWTPLKLLLISLPLSFTPLVIYSGDNATHNSMFGFMILIVIIDQGISYYYSK